MRTTSKKFFRSRLLAGVGGVAFLSIAGGFGAHAQTASAASPANVDEVVVTAQKRQERLIDTPLSVSVLGSEQLARLGATQFADFANTVPGLSFSTLGAGYNQVSLRGVTTGYDISQTVGIYVDEVPYGSSSAFADGARATLDVGLFDLQRVEVLRGPQGTLYGASTMGGVLKYVTRLPNASAFSGDLQAGVSTTKDGGISHNLAGAVNLPIQKDVAALRASVFESHDGGYIDNIQLGDKNVNRSDTYGGRLDFLFTPTDKLSVRLTGFVQDISRDGTGTADYRPAGTPENGYLDQRRVFREPFDQKFRLASGTINYELGWADLTSVSSYQTSKTDLFYDWTRRYAGVAFAAPYSIIGFERFVSTEKFAQELRLASSGNKTLEWLIGGYYTDETSKNQQRFIPYDMAGNLAPNTLFLFSTPTSFKEYAAFGNLTWHITDAFDVSGGIRYAKNDQTSVQNASGILAGNRPRRSAEDSVATYLANARYKFSDHATAYARFATGYRPGGPNFVGNDPVTGLPATSPTFAADTLKSYETGFKAETADRRYGFDIAAYYIDWNNLQISVVRNGFGIYANAPGGATIKGAELAVNAQPIDQLSINATLAYQDATLSKADADLKAAKGERLPNVPKTTATLNGDYRISDDGLRPSVGFTVRHVSKRAAQFNGSAQQYRMPAYTSVDFRAGLTVQKADVQFYVRNLFNEHGQYSANQIIAPVGLGLVTIQQPRTIGVLLRLGF